MYCFTQKYSAVRWRSWWRYHSTLPQVLNYCLFSGRKRINVFFSSDSLEMHGCIYGMHNILDVYFASSSIFICSAHELEHILVTRAWQQSDIYCLIKRMSVFCVAYLCLCVFFLPECRKLYSLSTYGLDYTTPQLSVLAESRRKFEIHQGGR